SVDPYHPRTPEWAVDGTSKTRHNLVTSIYIQPDDMERHIRKLEAKYRVITREETRWENYLTDDAELIFVGYGIISRILKSVVGMLRDRGVKAGLLRPITLFPFPTLELQRLAAQAERFFVVEMSTGQMVEDVKLAVEGRRPVEFYGRCGGNSPTAEEVCEEVMAHA
ncbi:MAG: 3-methyl-2-oxobutanoate dehydrogenase subunit beta, partial [Acidobacteria bacterium]|nr:3-methyl-2-oxobutanoate dehydrogenase subunit beta [Acidobacteriota bacterium]